LVYLKKVHSKLRITDISSLFFLNNHIKISLLFAVLFFTSCDFRVPQEWETPEWQFDLNIPLINDEYLMSSIASNSNDIQITHPDSSDFIVSINERIIEEGLIVTDESFFIIEESNLEFSLENIIQVQNPNPMPEIPNISETINMQNLFNNINIEEGTCIPKTPPGFENGYDTTIVFSIDSFCDGLEDIQCLELINWLRLDSGSNNFSVDNQLPFLINDLEFNISSEIGNFINENFSDIDGFNSRTTNLSSKTIGCDVIGSISLSISTPLITSSNSENCNICNELGNFYQNNECYIPIFIDENSCNQIEIEGQNAIWINDECRLIAEDISDSINCELLNLNWDNILNQCYQLIVIDSDNCENNGWVWLNEQNQCYLPCTQQQECCESISGSWVNDECINIPSFEGIKILDNIENLNLELSNEMNLESFESLNALVRDCDIPSTYSLPLVSDPNMSLVEGYISNTNNIDTNRIVIDLTNNLFTEIYADINSPNLVDSLGNVLIIETGNIGISESFDDIILSNYIIQNPEGGPLDSLDLTFQINIPDGPKTIEFDTNYGLSGDGVNIKTTELEALKVNLNEFSSPDINLGSVPSGLNGFDLPFLTFNLHMFNQISADMKLYLDLYGINETDTLLIHVEPDIKFLNELNPFNDTDSLTISFYQDTMSVVHNGNNMIHAEPIKTKMNHKISDLFKYDIIDVNGYAVMDGDATLLPDKSLWGDIEIIIKPLTIAIEDSGLFSFTASEFTQMNAMDRATASKIDSGLISSIITMNLNNKLPFAGDLLMYVSNVSDTFPFCIDSLITGPINQQEVTDTCISILENMGCQNFIVDTLNGYVKNMDCLTDDDNYYYNRLLDINFLSPNLDQLGNVLDSSLTQQEITLDDEVYYFTRDNTQYLIPRFVFSSELDTITLQPNNSLNVNSSILFRLLNTGIIE